MKCQGCNGTGYTPCGYCPPLPYKCHLCYGNKKIMCYDCGGRGTK